MRVPSLERFSRYLSGTGLFLSGMIVGAALYMSMHQQNFSLLITRNSELQEENAQLKKDIESLNKYKTVQSLIRKVSVQLEPLPSEQSPLDPITQTEIKKKIQQDLSAIYTGHLISDFTDPRETKKLREIVQKRITLSGKEYDIKFQTLLLIHTELTVLIQAKAHVPTFFPD